MAKSFTVVATHMRNSTIKKPVSVVENKLTPLPELIKKQGKNTDQTKASILSVKRDPIGGIKGVITPKIIGPQNPISPMDSETK